MAINNRPRNAKTVLDAIEKGDPRGMLLVVTVAQRANINANAVLEWIKKEAEIV